MKTTLMLAILAVAPALLAAEPDPSTPAQPANPASALSEDLADQAALVQQIGADAARGFDPEAHAHLLRLQIEALVAKTSPAVLKGSTAAEAPAFVQRVVQPALKAPAAAPERQAVAAPVPRESSVREILQKLRATLDELEAKLNGR